MLKHVLIPTDGSRRSAKAIKAGVALAKEMGARVTGFHGAGASATSSSWPRTGAGD